MKTPTLSRLLFLLLVCASASVLAATSGESVSTSVGQRPSTTYERFLPLAVAGDSAIQHFLGYMFFYGEGVELNYDEAHYWFHLAAEEGDARAQRNLGVFHSRAIPRVPDKFFDVGEANLWFSLAAANPGNPASSRLASQSYDRFLQQDLKLAVLNAGAGQHGKQVYQGYCAGCHGFGGYGAYSKIPSFAVGERLEKSDQALVDSIVGSRGYMATWGEDLSEEVAHQVVSYIRRELASATDVGKADSLQPENPGSDQITTGERIYLEFCGGCHGFNGIAWYVNSPSFALRERMEKSDSELATSIKNGRGAMPSWEHMLKPEQIDALIGFIRSLAQNYEDGIIGELRRPRNFLRFRPSSELGPNWTGDDLR